jgi:hypothetical protein
MTAAGARKFISRRVTMPSGNPSRSDSGVRR